jgi:Ca-activated chloride channel family protein
MVSRLQQWASVLVFLSCTAAAQVFSVPSSGFGNIGSSGMNGGPVASGDPTGIGLISSEQMTNNFFMIRGDDQHRSPLEGRSGSISRLDLKAPGKARREFEKGYQLLMRKDMQGAVDHLKISTALYPQFVAAHNALGSAYLALGQNDQARVEFAQAVSLDDHLPTSYLNLGVAQLAVKDFSSAQESIQKASSIAPLDLSLLTALAYGQFMNHDYPAVLLTARQVHDRKHEGASVVHYFAAGAWEAQNNLTEAQHEMETLLREDPKSPSAGQFNQILQQIKSDEAAEKEAKLHPPQQHVTFSLTSSPAPTAQQASQQATKILQDLKEKNQIAEAEAQPDATCTTCGDTIAKPPIDSTIATASNSRAKLASLNYPGATLRATVDEVAVFFAATDHGRSVTNLTASEIGVRDDSQPPDAILGFRNEAQLPLRLGLIIDTSNSITSRFTFEQAAAIKFLQKVVTNKDDLAFVVGVNNSVLLVQDFTGDQTLASHAIGQLAPGGGTAMWDAVTFAADKLASHPEVQPVARILVVISDGEDNSSSFTLKQAIEHAQRGEVAVYTVSTRDGSHEEPSALLGDHALATVSELTGGAAFTPGSISRLNSSLADLQQVIRGRYLVSYKPAAFHRNGKYRTIDIAAQKDGHKLKVYARKGYYASVAQPSAADQ